MPLYVFDFRENSGNGGRCHWVNIIQSICANCREDSVLNCSPRDTASGHIMRGGDLLWTPVVTSLCALPAGSALRMPLWSTGTLLRLTPALLQRGLEALSSCHGFLQLLLETLLSNLPFLLLHGQGSVML